MQDVKQFMYFHMPKKDQLPANDLYIYIYIVYKQCIVTLTGSVFTVFPISTTQLTKYQISKYIIYFLKSQI